MHSVSSHGLANDSGAIQKAIVIFAILFIALIVSPNKAFAQSGVYIFDVKRSLPLEPNEPTYHDFYINAGPEAGFKKGSYVSVVRAVPVHDPIQNKQQGTLNIPIGHLQIIHVEKGITVARLHNELNGEQRPTVEFEAIMIGDKVDTSSITTTAPGQKKQRAQAQPAIQEVLKPAPEAPAAVPATAPQRALPIIESPTTTESHRNSFPLVAQPDMSQLQPRKVDFFGF